MILDGPGTGPATGAFRAGSPDGSGTLPPVQVFGENELADRLRRGGEVGRFLVSIGNPRGFLSPKVPGTRVPPIFRERFERVLRLAFFDVDDVSQLGRMRPRRVAERRDVERVARFFAETRASGGGWTVHCWQGLSRSPAVALGLLYLQLGDEGEAGKALRSIRPEARPLQRVVRLFDDVLGSRLSEVNEGIRAARIEEMRVELDLHEDALLEELPAAE